jgi:hypothetical protein
MWQPWVHHSADWNGYRFDQFVSSGADVRTTWLGDKTTLYTQVPP